MIFRRDATISDVINDVRERVSNSFGTHFHEGNPRALARLASNPPIAR
jgi:hypothetical protein